MNATEKQKGFIYALQRKLGREPNAQEIENCTSQEASAWIDQLLTELAKNGNEQKKPVFEEKKPEIQQNSSEFNSAVFGLACKLVVQKYGVHEAIARKEIFLATARELYETMIRARQAVELGLKGPGSPEVKA